MLSKRNFFMMFTIIIVILAIFLSSVALKEYYNDYDVNHMAPAEVVSKQLRNAESSDDAEKQVIYFGEEDGYFNTVKEWTQYRKKSFASFSSLSNISKITASDGAGNQCLIIDGEMLQNNTVELTGTLTDYTNRGGVVILYRLPSYETISGCDALRELLGIQHLRAESVKLNEIRLYSGFLLGGETHYPFEGVEKPELADMQREVPWYDISARTKTYMVGFLSSEEKDSLGINNEDMPAIIWRSNMGEGSVFSINGDYLKDSGFGILDAITYETEEYSLYSVVNAQNLSCTGFPVLTEENETLMAKVYGMTAEQFCRDILWPSFVSAARKNNWKITSFVSVKYSDSSNVKPKVVNLIDYLKYFNEESAEAGVSLGRINSSDIRRSVKEEKKEIKKLNLNYLFAGGYVRQENKDKLEELLDDSGNMNYFTDIRTVVGEYAKGERILYWMSDNITYQNATTDAYTHSYRDNLMLKSIETSLGYSNVQADMYRVLNPKDEKDQWQNLADKMSANIDTYWKPFSAFDKTTISQSDARVRNFLNGSVRSSKNGNVITVNTDGFSGEAYLILRTHGAQIDSITGGSFKNIEDNAYLITLTDNSAKIILKSEPEFYYVDK